MLLFYTVEINANLSTTDFFQKQFFLKTHNPKYLNDHLLYNTAHFISVNTLYQRELMPYILQLQTALNRLHQFCVEQTLPPA